MSAHVRLIGSAGQVAAWTALHRARGLTAPIVHAAPHPHDPRAVPPDEEATP
jgi:hypothetical protein